jgi:flagellin FlaB
MKNVYSEDAFTGLEAAIVLIAFVVVAAVFSYVVLGAGFFTTQTAQATVHTGVAQASSSLEVVGNVMGIATGTAPLTRISYINTSVALTAGGTPMDLTQMVISYSDNAGGRNPSIANNTDGINTCTGVFTDAASSDLMRWCVSQKINDLNAAGSENNLLESNEIWVLSIGMPPTATVNTKITVNMQPAVGAVLPVSRTLPGGLNAVQAIY